MNDDIEKIFKTMKPVDTPPELRRKIFTQIASEENESFWKWFLNDWGGWTARIWMSIPCLILGFSLYAFFNREPQPMSMAQSDTLSTVTLKQIILAHQNLALSEDLEPPQDQPKQHPRTELRKEDLDAFLQTNSRWRTV